MGVYGFKYWWPAASPLEVIEGAILAQNTSWKNAERAMARIRDKSPRNILNSRDLSNLIRPAGFHNQKEKYLRDALEYYISKIESLALPYDTRQELLGLKGIGLETADSIALYGFHQRTFPVDSYAIRLLSRYFGNVYRIREYEEIRSSLVQAFSTEQLMELHALIDEHCKVVCRKKPLCIACSLNKECKQLLL